MPLKQPRKRSKNGLAEQGANSSCVAKCLGYVRDLMQRIPACNLPMRAQVDVMLRLKHLLKMPAAPWPGQTSGIDH